jgi:F5/8 type C domain
VDPSTPRPRRVQIGTLVLCLAVGFARVSAATSSWVQPGPEGRLVYQPTPAGDRIMDFSGAGYGGGGVPLPEVPVRQTVNPSGGDDSAAIQAALDAVAARPLRNGFRGAVLLGPGKFTCARSLTLAASGVVLRGSGSGLEPGAPGPATTIWMTGPKHEAILIGPPRARAPRPDPLAPTTLAAAYVPAGAAAFEVADAVGLAAGDVIEIARPTTPAWVAFMRMNELKRDGKAQTWIARSRSELTERTLIAVSGRRLTVDVPLADSYDARYLNPPGVTVRKIRPAAAVTHDGVEHLRLQCPPLEIDYGAAPYSAIRVGGNDCWIRDVACEETMNSTTLAGKRITVEQVVVTHTFPNLGASKPTDFSIEGSQILIDRCRISGENEYFVWTNSLETGPNVVLNCTFAGRGSRLQPHERWSTGLLVDNCRVPDGGIDFMNRGVGGSGHGWTMGWAVAWNCLAKTYVIQNPPGVCNWAIGCIGARQQTAAFFQTAPLEPEGVFDSPGVPVTPASLYLAQLAERLGPGALAALGYAANSAAVLAEPTLRLTAPYPADVDPVLGPDLALHRPVNTSSVRGATREFGGEKALDANPATAWATPDGAVPATLEVDTEGPLEINAVVIEEAEGAPPGVLAYTVEGQVDSDWQLLARGTTIGPRQVHRFPAVTVWKVRLTIQAAQPYAAIRKFGIYRAP